MVRLRAVFYDPDAVDAGSRLSLRAFEACERADVLVVEGGDVSAVMREHGLIPQECIGVGRSFASEPLGTVWVSPLDLEVRGSTVRVAEEPDELLYEAVVAELAQRR